MSFWNKLFGSSKKEGKSKPKPAKVQVTYSSGHGGVARRTDPAWKVISKNPDKSGWFHCPRIHTITPD
jgi:hypothetical protein